MADKLNGPLMPQNSLYKINYNIKSFTATAQLMEHDLLAIDLCCYYNL